MSACKAPAWCDCDDCRFWRKHKYYPRGWFHLKRRYPWEPAAHVRAWRALGRLARDRNPVALLRLVEMSDWAYEREDSAEARVARMVIRRWDKAVLALRALFGKWDMDQSRSSLCERTLYRLKAVVCLVLDWQPRDMNERCECFGFTFWNAQEYGTPDGPGGSWEELQVGYGWGNWFVYVEHESWP